MAARLVQWSDWTQIRVLTSYDDSEQVLQISAKSVGLDFSPNPGRFPLNGAAGGPLIQRSAEKGRQKSRSDPIWLKFEIWALERVYNDRVKFQPNPRDWNFGRISSGPNAAGGRKIKRSSTAEGRHKSRSGPNWLKFLK